MEEMPFQLLLSVILFGFTLWAGFTAWDYARINEEKASCYRTLNTLLIKSQLVLSGAPGSREKINLVVEGNSKLKLFNEKINGSVYGILKAEFPDGSQQLQVLPVPFSEDRVFLAGEYSVTMVHEKNSNEDFLRVEG